LEAPTPLVAARVEYPEKTVETTGQFEGNSKTIGQLFVDLMFKNLLAPVSCR